MLEEIVIVILLVFGTCFGGLILWKIFDMVRSSIKGNNNAEITGEDFDRLARAFMQHSKEMQERVQNLEAFIADDGEKEQQSQIEAPKNRGNLSNELKEKDKV